MNVLVKNALRSVGKSKFSTLLLIVTIVLVTTVFFFSSSASDVIYSVLEAEYSRINLDADILVGSSGGGETFSRSVLESVLDGDDKVSSADYFLRTTALLKERDNASVLLEATDLNVFLKKNKSFKLVATATVNGYPEAIVSEKFLSEYGYEAGDLITIFSPISSTPIKYAITKVVTAEGFFSSGTIDSVLVDYSTAGALNLVNNVLIKLNDPSLKAEYIEKISAILPSVSVGSALPEDVIDSLLKQTSALYAAAMCFVVLLMGVILFTTYLLLAKKRVGEIAIFKSVGATPLSAVSVLIAETLLYGIIGALIGLPVGRLLMGVLISNLLPSAESAISYDLWKYLASFLGAVLLSVLAGLPSAISLGKKTVRELTSKTERRTVYHNKYLCLILVVLIVGLLIATLLTESTASLILALVLTPVVAVGLFLLTPYVVKGVSHVFSAVSKKGLVKIHSSNARRNASSALLTVILAVIIGFTFLFVSVIGIVVSGITPYRTRLDADSVIITTDGAASDIVSEIIAEGAYAGAYREDSILIYIDGKSTSVTAYETDSDDVIERLTQGVGKEAIDKFLSEKNAVILNYDLAKELGYTVGDVLILGYKIETSSNSTEFLLDGNYVVVGLDYTNNSYPQGIFIKSADLGEKPLSSTVVVAVDGMSLERADEIAESYGGYAVTRDVYAYTGQDPTGLIALIYVLEAAFIVIALTGLVNLVYMTLYDRDYEWYVFKSVGGSYGDYVRGSLIEGLVVAVSGMLEGLIVAILFSSLVPSMYELVGKHPYYTVLNLSLLAVTVFGGLVYMAIITVSRLTSARRYASLSKKAL